MSDGKRALLLIAHGSRQEEANADLDHVVAEMRRRGRYPIVWFNAWKYDGKEVIWNALIQTVLLKMRDDAGAAKSGDVEAFKKNVIRVSKELAKYAAKVGTRFVPGGILREEDVDAFLRAIADLGFSPPE